MLQIVIETHRNKDVRHPSFVLLPCFAVLGATSLNISERSMDDHTGEKNRVKPRERAFETRNESPSKCEINLVNCEQSTFRSVRNKYLRRLCNVSCEHVHLPKYKHGGLRC